MNTIYSPTYTLLSYNNIPFMVAIDTITIDRYDPFTGNEFEEERPYVESVLMGGHEMVDLLTEEVVDELLKLAVTSE
jgi:hypothetical protein